MKKRALSLILSAAMVMSLSTSMVTQAEELGDAGSKIEAVVDGTQNQGENLEEETSEKPETGDEVVDENIKDETSDEVVPVDMSADPENSGDETAESNQIDSYTIDLASETNSEHTHSYDQGVAKIGDKTYQTLQEAVEAATEGDEIDLCSDVTACVIITKNLTIDLNGYTLTADKEAIMTEYDVSLVLKSTDKMGTITGATYGAVLARGALSIDNVLFEGNSINVAPNGFGNDGGAVSAFGRNDIEVNIKNCKFENNTSQDNGGAVFIGGKAYLNMSNTSFVNNYAQVVGGAVSISQDGITHDSARGAKIEDCSFSANSTKGSGAAINVSSGTVTVENSKFESNQAQSNGGAINSFVAIETKSCTFKNNVVKWEGLFPKGYGGAVYCWLDYTDEGSTFTGNYALREGGAIYIKSGECTLNGTRITENSADENGGAIANNTAKKLTLSGAIVYNNKAKAAGDDIYSKGSVTLCNTGSDWKLTDDETPIDGWYLDNESTRWTAQTATDVYEEYKKSEDGSISPKAEEMLAIKAAHGTYCTVTYSMTGQIPEGTELPAQVSLKKGATFTVADAFAPVTVADGNTTKTYTFSGWMVDGKAVSGQQTANGDMTLTGTWTYSEETVDPTPSPEPTPAPSNGGSGSSSSSSTGTVTIASTEVPLAGPSQETVTIADEETPLAAPKTGESNTMTFYLLLFAASALTLVHTLFDSKKKKEDK